MVRSTTKHVCRNGIPNSIPLPVRPGKFSKCYWTFEAHGQKAASAHRCIPATTFRGNSNSKIADISRKRANAGLQQPKARPDDGQRPQTWQQAGMREAYVETGERGFGLLQGIVSIHVISPIPLLPLFRIMLVTRPSCCHGFDRQFEAQGV